MESPFTTQRLPSEQKDEEVEEPLIPTENFAMVAKGIYRSSFPKRKNFSFLKKLGLKSVL
jgi:tyrosine-protein phosphatase SIW14